jgi:hypothetical protein
MAARRVLSQILGQRDRFVSKNGTKQKTATPCRASGLRMLPNYFSGVWPILLIGRGGVEKKSRRRVFRVAPGIVAIYLVRVAHLFNYLRRCYAVIVNYELVPLRRLKLNPGDVVGLDGLFEHSELPLAA